MEEDRREGMGEGSGENRETGEGREGRGIWEVREG